MMISMPVLQIIWWLLVGVLLAGFAVMDGFDFGAAILSPLIGRTSEERRLVLTTVGPVWEGNQVWLILGAGALFAAWPEVYGVAFSGLYFSLLAVLVTLILRPVGFKYREKLVNPVWQKTWDWLLFASGFFAAILFGVAVGNAIQGLPFSFNEDHRMLFDFRQTHFITLFTVLCGLVNLMLFVMQGGYYLSTKVKDPLKQRAAFAAKLAAFGFVLLFIMTGFVLGSSVDGFSLSQSGEVTRAVGGWLLNYSRSPVLMLVPLVAILAAIVSVLLSVWDCCKSAFMASSAAVFMTVLTVGVSMYPIFLPSSTSMGDSLTVWNGSASHLTLLIMLGATCFFLPIILLYTAWVYRVLKGKVDTDAYY